MRYQEVKKQIEEVYEYINHKNNYNKEMWKETYDYLYSLESSSLTTEEIMQIQYNFMNSRVYHYYLSKTGKNKKTEEMVPEKIEIKEKEKEEKEFNLDIELFKEMEKIMDRICEDPYYKEYLKRAF